MGGGRFCRGVYFGVIKCDVRDAGSHDRCKSRVNRGKAAASCWPATWPNEAISTDHLLKTFS
jgi:hypothetical protein